MSLRRTLRWAPYEGTGLEHVSIAEGADGIRVTSTVIGHKDGVDYGVLYEIVLDPDWTFRSATFERTDGATRTLRSDPGGTWADGQGQALPELDGCIDIDISATPFTNTLPIRRNRNWVIGEPRRFDMGWVPIDTLEPFRDGQIYTPLGDRKWRYQAADGSFEAEITVDEDGLVVDYPGLYRRIE